MNITYKLQYDKHLNESDNNIPVFSLKGKIKKAKIVDVYDGNGCTAVFYLNKTLYKWNIRLSGYELPELRHGKFSDNRHLELKKATESRKFLKSLIMKENQLVYIKCGDFDKYGRLLGEIFINKNDSKSVNQLMIKHGRGVPYDGCNKLKFM